MQTHVGVQEIQQQLDCHSMIHDLVAAGQENLADKWAASLGQEYQVRVTPSACCCCCCCCLPARCCCCCRCRLPAAAAAACPLQQYLPHLISSSQHWHVLCRIGWCDNAMHPCSWAGNMPCTPAAGPGICHAPLQLGREYAMHPCSWAGSMPCTPAAGPGVCHAPLQLGREYAMSRTRWWSASFHVSYCYQASFYSFSLHSSEAPG
jgi:hypothetical protein